MTTERLGTTSLRVSKLGFGAAPLGGFRGKILESDVEATLVMAYGGGINLFDTSPFYGYGRSEHRIGHFLRELPRKSFVLSTKVGRWLKPLDQKSPPLNLRQGGLRFQPCFDYSADGTMRSLEQSIMRLGIPEIDIIYIHDVDVFTHGTAEAADGRYKEAMEGCYPALEKLRSEGVIKAIGVGLNETERSLRFVRDTDIDCILLAGRYTLLEQEPLDELLPACMKHDISIVLGGPYNSGVLATGLTDDAKYDYGDVPNRIGVKVKQLQLACQRHSVDLIAAALQFPLAHPTVVSVIPGAMNTAEQQANMSAMRDEISADFWQDLKDSNLIREDAPVPPENPLNKS